MIGNPIKWFITITDSCTSSANIMWKWWLHFSPFVSKWCQNLRCTLIHSRRFPAVLLQVQFSPSVYHRALMGRWGTARVVQLQGRSLCCPGWPGDHKTLPTRYLMASGNPSHRIKYWWVLCCKANLWMLWMQMLAPTARRFLLPSTLPAPCQAWGIDSPSAWVACVPPWPALLAAKATAMQSRENRDQWV